MVAGVGLEPHDLRVMSPTSYQLLYPAIYGAHQVQGLLYYTKMINASIIFKKIKLFYSGLLKTYYIIGKHHRFYTKYIPKTVDKKPLSLYNIYLTNYVFNYCERRALYAKTVR